MELQLADETLEAVFARLKPYCVDLLDLLRNPRRRAPFLRDLADLLRRAPPHALQPSLDYTMFPLLLLLDAAVQCRAAADKADAPMRGLKISDSVAEGVLMCVEELLRKCHLGSINQMVVVLKKLTSGAMLSPDEAAEEFRGGILRCLRALLFRIQPCSNGYCSCKKIMLPTIISNLEAQYSTPLRYFHEPDECLLAFLQSQDASAAVGHWLSLLLQIAETEVSRGHRGSSSLRKEALLTLRVLVAKIGSPDALAFFLPGTVSRFSKAMHLTKTMISGAAGSTGGTEHAVYGLSEFLMIVLNDAANLDTLGLSPDSCIEHSPLGDSAQSVLLALRCLPLHQSKDLDENSMHQSNAVTCSNGMLDKSTNQPNGGRTLYVKRTKEWMDRTTENVDKLISATFPHLSTHPAEKIRKGVVESVRGILTNCCCTLRRSKMMLLECLCVLVCDESVVVSAGAHESLQSLFMLGEKFLNENEVSEILTSLIEKLPKVVLGNDETVALSHARKLLALMYYAGPDLVVEHLLGSPIKAACFLDFLRLSLSHNSQFSGPVNKLILSKPLSAGYLLSVAELKAGTLTSLCVGSGTKPVSEVSVFRDKNLDHPRDDSNGEYELPRMPPWFINIGSEKLYVAIAGILRLSGLSVMAGCKTDVPLSLLVDVLLDQLQKLISELRMRDYNKEGWQAWYTQSGSGYLLRQTSSAICMLNEIIYGLSDQPFNSHTQLFGRAGSEIHDSKGLQFPYDNYKSDRFIYDGSVWKVSNKKVALDHVIYCIGTVLHEYLSPELWDLPSDQNSPLLEQDTQMQLSLHFFRDVTMLHQVIVEGIGIFSMVLRKDFTSSGFMHSTLYLLLKNLICSSGQIRRASDSVLRVLASTTGHSSVGHLVIANPDYIIDSLCRQLRHLDLNPHVPYVFAAILSYIGAAKEILPLLEEPMQAVSSELEVLGRHQHPHLTIPFLKAVNEITKASRSESCEISVKAESFHGLVYTEASGIHAKDIGNDGKLSLEHLEELLLQLNEMRRYRRIVGSLAESCLRAAIPLLSSSKESACLLSLNITEDVTVSLAKIKEAYKHEKETKTSINKLVQLSSSIDLQDSMDTADDEADENRLLPAMNKMWPYLILCLKNKVSLAVISRCTSVISRAIQVSGGDFFIRRFHTDGPVIWRLLASSPFQPKPFGFRAEKQILLPYRSPQSPEAPMAETSTLKIQVAILNMIAEISSNKKSASAIEAVLKKVAGLVVGIACSSVTGLRDASMKALSGLACIDPDLIWLLVADVYYSSKNKAVRHPQPPSSGLPEIRQLLPPPSSPKDYLYKQYGGESSGFDLDFSSVEFVFQRMCNLGG